MVSNHLVPRLSRTSRTPCLPNEIWLGIFDFATLSPHAFITGDLTPTAPRQCVSRYEERRILGESTRNLKDVVRVCKLWNILATPNLYRVILLNKRLHLLERTLSSSQQELADKPDIRPLGWWTRRFDLDPMVLRRPGEVTHVANIIRYTPNLAVFITPNYHFSSAIPNVHLLNEVSNALKEVCVQSLQVLILNAFSGPVNDVLMSFLSAAAPNLRVLSCPYIRGVSGLSLPYAPQIKSLAVSADDCSLYHKPTDETNHLPSLQNLTIFVKDARPTVLSEFLRIHGIALTTVQIIYGDARSDRELMSIIARSCPRLVRLDMHGSPTTLADSIPHLPSVTILGLRRWWLTDDNDMKTLLTALRRQTCPSLKTIQFLALDQFLKSMHFHAMSSIIMDLPSGIRVQDGSGVDLFHNKVICVQR